jgi:DNA-directed RNA polymerase specialized sigma subunit
MARKIVLTQEQKAHRDRLIKSLFKETELTLEQIGRIFGISKQGVSKILKQ